MKTLVVLTALWKRHDLSRLMLEHTLAMAKKCNGFNVRIVAVVSPDEDPESVGLCKGTGIEYACAENAPLGRKWQHGLACALASGECDAVMLLGSDDFATEHVFRAAAKAIFEDDATVFGFSDFYFIGQGPRACYWPGYSESSGRMGEPMGAGRTFSRELLICANKRLWKDDLERGLDQWSWARLTAASEFLPMRVATIPLAACGGMLVDVKRGTGEQMSPLQRYFDTGSQEIDWRLIVRYFDVALAEAWNLDDKPLFHSRRAEAAKGRPAKVGLAMIAGNAGETIERAIRSAMPIIGEATVIVDDRTTDGTRDGLLALGVDRCIDRAWEGFAKQRNYAHFLTLADWHLVLDADETLEIGDLPEAIERAEKEGADAVLVTVHARIDAGVMLQMQARVLRRGVATWVYRCHNDLVGVKKTVMSSAIIRQSYQGLARERAERAIPVLLEMFERPIETLVTAEQEKLHAANFLSQAYFGLGDWEKCVEWADWTVRHDTEGTYPEACARLARAMLVVDQLRGEQTIKDMLWKHPDFADLHYLQASMSFARWILNIMRPGRYAGRPIPSLAFAANYPRICDLAGFSVRVETRPAEDEVASQEP